jgi:CheY-like chemotaxis protein
MTTILVVEDHAAGRNLLRDMLEVWGYSVLEADEVEAGWDALQREPVALVVMDIQLPGGGGEALLSRMKLDSRLRAVPVVAVTAFAMRGDRERLLASGFDEYIAKPIDTRTFPGVVARCLRATSHE